MCVKSNRGMNEKVEVIDRTMSLCPECLELLPAEIFVREGKVWMRKRCRKHGEFTEIYWSSYEMYERAKRYAKDGRGISNPNVRKKKPRCPYDCGLCGLHLSHTALANIVVTNRCDLRCWYCFFYAQRVGYVYEPTLEQIRHMVRRARRERPIPCQAVQLTGGEPCLRDDLIHIVRICKEEGIRHVQLNTDGIRLANDPTLASRVREAGVNVVYLSFDGVTPKTNPKNYWEIPAALNNCRKAGLGVVLVPTIIRTINDHEIGKMVKFAARNIDIVRGLNFQPVSLVGRIPRKERSRFRITIPDLIKCIEEQTNGEVTGDDFFPVPAAMPISELVEAITGEPTYELTAHFACGMATYVFRDGKRLVPISRFMDVEGFLEYLEEKAKEIREGRSKYLVLPEILVKFGSFIDKQKMPKGMSVAKLVYGIFIKHDYSALGKFHDRALFIGMMHFQDLYNWDIERVKRCCIHYLTPDERIIPFCAFNVIPEWYRDVIQQKYGIPIPEWEKRTGKKIANDFYKRDLQKRKVS